MSSLPSKLLYMLQVTKKKKKTFFCTKLNNVKQWFYNFVNVLYLIVTAICHRIKKMYRKSKMMEENIQIFSLGVNEIMELHLLIYKNYLL